MLPPKAITPAQDRIREEGTTGAGGNARGCCANASRLTQFHGARSVSARWDTRSVVHNLSLQKQAEQSAPFCFAGSLLACLGPFHITPSNLVCYQQSILRRRQAPVTTPQAPVSSATWLSWRFRTVISALFSGSSSRYRWVVRCWPGLSTRHNPWVLMCSDQQGSRSTQ